MNGEEERLIQEANAPLIRSPRTFPDRPNADASTGPSQWQQRLRETHGQLHSDLPAHGAARGEIWLILNFAVSRFLAYHAQHLGPLSDADLEDIASEKSLDLVRKLDSGTWEITDRTDEEIAGFVSRVARNGAVDFLRRRHRHREIEVDLDRSRDAAEHGVRSGLGRPDADLERRRFAEALKECAGQIKPRTRRIWFFRVFYGLSTREIALHPEVAIKPKGVESLVDRTSRSIGDCMERKGHRVTELPAGAFVEMWDWLQSQQ